MRLKFFLLALILLVMSCSTWEQMGKPSYYYHNRKDISWAEIGMTKPEVESYVGTIINNPDEVIVDSLGTTEVYIWNGNTIHLRNGKIILIKKPYKRKSLFQR